MVCFLELPSKEAKKLGKAIHQPLTTEHAPSSVLKVLFLLDIAKFIPRPITHTLVFVCSLAQARYRAHTFNQDAFKPSEQSTEQMLSPAELIQDASSVRCPQSPYHTGILSRSWSQTDLGEVRRLIPKALNLSGELEGARSDQDEDDFFLHLRQGARKMSSAASGGAPRSREASTEEEREESVDDVTVAEGNGEARAEGGGQQQRPEGEPLVSPHDSPEQSGEEEEEKTKKPAPSDRYHFGLTNILHKPTHRNSIRKVMVRDIDNPHHNHHRHSAAVARPHPRRHCARANTRTHTCSNTELTFLRVPGRRRWQSVGGAVRAEPMRDDRHQDRRRRKRR
jgi:hypothetical protein